MQLRKALGAVLVALVVLAGATPARATAGCHRQCKIEAANKYLAALVSHDGSDVPLRDDAWRQENGGDVLTGGDNIRAALSNPIMFVITGIHDLRWYADGDDVVAVYFLDTVAPTYIFERFAVDNAGFIYQIDAHFYIDTSGHVSGPESVVDDPDERQKALFEANHGPLGPVPVQEGNTGDDATRSPIGCGPDCVELAAHAFLDAMETGSEPDVTLAGNIVQTINRRPIDDVRGHLADSADRIDSVAKRLVQVDGNQATVLYEIELTDGGRYYGASRFLVTGTGAIKEIEAVCDGAELCN